MAIKQPISTDPLNVPDHSLSHRVFANDDAAPVKSVIVDSNGWVGLQDTTPLSKFQIGGSYGLPTASISSDSSLDATHVVVFVSGNTTIQLPTAIGITGRTYFIVKTDGYPYKMILSTSAGQTISGNSTQETTSQYVCLQVVSDGSNWFLM